MPNEPKNRNNVEISYSIDQNLETTIDILLEDYSEETILQLCTMLDVLSCDGTYLETVQVIAENLKSQGRNEELYKLVSHVTAQQTKKALAEKSDNEQEYSPNIKERPCIKPSDML